MFVSMFELTSPVPTSPSAEMTPGILHGPTMPGGKGSLLVVPGCKSPQNHSPATELPMNAVFS